MNGKDLNGMLRVFKEKFYKNVNVIASNKVNLAAAI